MKNVYLILTQSGTILSKLIRLFSHKPYNHASIGLDKSLDKFYSFGRLKPHNAFIGGFVIERKDAGVFKLFKNAPSLVVELSITDEQYNTITNTITVFEQNKEEYKYDFVNLTIFFTKYRIPRKKRFFCSQFVAYILNNAGIKTPNPPEHTQATDFLSLENSRVIYNGFIQEYEIEKTTSFA